MHLLCFREQMEVQLTLPKCGSQTRILVDSRTRTYPLNLLCGSLMNHLLSVESFILLIYSNGFSSSCSLLDA